MSIFTEAERVELRTIINELGRLVDGPCSELEAINCFNKIGKAFETLKPIRQSSEPVNETPTEQPGLWEIRTISYRFEHRGKEYGVAIRECVYVTDSEEAADIFTEMADAVGWKSSKKKVE